jgi:hypothetical protein
MRRRIHNPNQYRLVFARRLRAMRLREYGELRRMMRTK